MKEMGGEERGWSEGRGVRGRKWRRINSDSPLLKVIPRDTS